jgi:hypothetical protein
VLNVPFHVFRACWAYVTFNRSLLDELSQGQKSEASFQTTTGLFASSSALLIFCISNINHFGMTINEIKQGAVAEQLSSFIALLLPTAAVLFLLKRRSLFHLIFNVVGCFFFFKMLFGTVFLILITWSEPFSTDSELFMQGRGNDTPLYAKVCGEIQANIDFLRPMRSGLQSGKKLVECTNVSANCNQEYRAFILNIADYFSEIHASGFVYKNASNRYDIVYSQENIFGSYFDKLQSANTILFFLWFLKILFPGKVRIWPLPIKELSIAGATLLACTITKNISSVYIYTQLDGSMNTVVTMFSNLSNYSQSTPNELYISSKTIYDDAVRSARLSYISQKKYCPSLDKRDLW